MDGMQNGRNDMQITAQWSTDPEWEQGWGCFVCVCVYLVKGHWWSCDILAVWFGSTLSVIYDQVNGHLSFQAADVPVAEIITQLVNLCGEKT